MPHGISSASGNTSFVARLGMVMPVEGAGVLAFPVSMGARFEPLATFLRPVAGVEAGGYLLIPRDGRMAPREEAGPPWYWSMRALVGTRVSVSRAVALTLYVDAAWIQQPRDELARLQVYSGVGAGAEVSVSFVPGLRYVDMFLNGRNAPEGF